MTDWINACSIDSLGQGEMFSFDHNEKKLLLNTFDDEKYFNLKRMQSIQLK